MDTATAARHSMDSPEWYTPLPFVTAGREVMGAIDLDPMSHEDANRTVNATRFFTEHDSCFKHPWHGRIFLNPAGGLVNEAWKYLVEEWLIGRTTQAIWIGYSLEQLQTLQQAKANHTPLDFPICITAKRIAFIENEAKRLARIKKLTEYNEANAAFGGKQRHISQTANSPSHANYITYLGPNVRAFERVFSQFGAVRRFCDWKTKTQWETEDIA